MSQASQQFPAAADEQQEALSLPMSQAHAFAASLPDLSALQQDFPSLQQSHDAQVFCLLSCVACTAVCLGLILSALQHEPSLLQQSAQQLALSMPHDFRES